MEVIVNSTLLKENAEDLMMLSNELNDLFNDMFERFSFINTRSREWIGTQADNYVTQLMKSKVDYMAFKNQLYMYGKLLNDVATKYDIISRNRGNF